MRMKFPSQSSAASVLIVVMVVCLGLVSLTLVFGRSMLTAYRGADNGLAGVQAQLAIEGGVRYAEYLITSGTQAGAMPDSTTFQSDALPVGDGTFWFIGEPSATDPVDTPAFGLVDEASKLNLNTATSTMLQGLPGMTQDIADYIVSWRTTSTSGTSAATSTMKYAPFESVDELVMVTGTDATLLYGQDANLNHVIDSNESAATSTLNSGSRIDSGLFEYVTVFSREPNVQTDGTTARVNVTKLSSTALSTLLTTAFGASRAEQILAKARAAGTITSVLGFYVRSGMTETEFTQIAANLTAKDGTYVTGLINVNTASQTVLACIPGISSSMASQLIATRSAFSTLPTTCTWVVSVLGEENAVTAGPYLTGATYQLSADIAAVGRNGRGYRRTRFVIDNSTGTPRIVYRRNMGALGWALGSSVRQTLAQKK
jgi:DNA uptake protein ComE-like DNA-binding protein